MTQTMKTSGNDGLPRARRTGNENVRPDCGYRRQPEENLLKGRMIADECPGCIRLDAHVSVVVGSASRMSSRMALITVLAEVVEELQYELQVSRCSWIALKLLKNHKRLLRCETTEGEVE
jgi:hypothetical protein